MKKFIFFLFTLASLFSLQASHFMGVDLWYECLGGCTYRIYHRTYYDCGGAATAAYVQPVSNSNPYPAPSAFSAIGIGGIAPAVSNSPILSAWQDVTPVCAAQPSQCNTPGAIFNGVAEAIYYVDYNVCGTTCTSIMVSWYNCCRNYALTSGANGQSIYTALTIDLVNAPCNNSPYFTSPPPSYIAAAQTTVVAQNVFEADGDSLVYSFVNCLSANNTPLTYNPGYSTTSPLGPGWDVQIDPSTGLLSFTPIAPLNGPVVIGNIGIKVSEYRNGILIDSIRRDMQVAVVNMTGPTNFNPTFTLTNLTGAYVTGTNVLHTYPNVACSFDIQATDANAGQLLSYASNLALQFPTAILTGIANTNPLQLHFTWTPDTSDIGNNYPLYIDIFDDNCPIIAHTYCLYQMQVEPFGYTISVTPAICGLTGGSIDFTPITGISPLNYSWNNGATTQDITNVPAGAYWLQITSGTSFSWISDTFYINSNNLATTFTSISPDCTVPNGSITAATSGGTSPYTYTWNTGQTGNSINNLGIGGYSVDISDALGCFQHEVLFLNFDPADSCTSKIGGRLYYDTNSNCVQDSWEVGVPNAYIDVTPGGAMLTDALGDYAFTIANTGTYGLTYTQGTGMQATSVCVPTFAQNVSVMTLGVDSLQKHFPTQFNPDIQVHLYESLYSPGAVHYATLVCHNISYYLSNATVSYQHDTCLLNPVFTIPPTSYNPATYTATWNLTNFNAGTYQTIHIQGTTDPNAVLGDTVTTITNIVPVIGDINPVDNQDTVICIVGASYDPNNKQVFPQGETNYGLIPQTTPKLEYVLNFQNTGTYPAQVVILRDTIDSDLDITSIDMQISSHPCTITIENDEILVFTFNNINLPDSSTDEPNSHGFVKFGMNLKPNLPLDTQIDNKVAIYFDYNAPVITNSVKNTLYNPMQLVMADSFTLCPTDLLTLTVQDGKAPYTFSWDNGTLVSGNTTGVCTIPANFLNGMHTVQVSDFYGAIRNHAFSFATVLPIADASFSSSSTGNTVAFNANVQGLASYAWDFGNGQTSNQPSANITYTNAGTYPVSLIVTDNCGRKDTMTTEINISVNIADAEFTQHIRLFPNPFSQFTTLSFDNPDNSPYELSIFDLSGKLVQKISNIRSNEVKISMENKAKGSYLWELKGKSKARGMLWVE